MIIVLEGLKEGIADAENVSHKILRQIIEPIQTSKGEATVNVSIGIALHAAGCGLGTDALLQTADQKMYEAKRAGKGKVRF